MHVGQVLQGSGAAYTSREVLADGRLKIPFHRETLELLGVLHMGGRRCRAASPWASGHFAEGQDHLFCEHGLQLSDAGGMLQSGGVQRTKSAELIRI
jgi:hypothetical protein